MAADRPRFCEVCATALVSERGRLQCPACQRAIYMDPKVAAGALVRVDGRIVLVQRDIEPSRGLWTFPGGYVDRYEPVPAAAAREVREETGLEVALDGLLGVYSYTDSMVVVVTYLAHVIGGEMCAADECMDARLFGADEIPWDQLAFPSTRDALGDFIALGGR